MIGTFKALPRGQTAQWTFNRLLGLTGAGATATGIIIYANTSAASPGHPNVERTTARRSSHRSCRNQHHHPTAAGLQSYHRVMSSSLFLGSQFFSHKTACEAAIQEFGDHHHHQPSQMLMEEEEEDISEEERFLDTLALYRRWIEDIRKQWDISSPSSIKWPNNIPDQSEVSALEMDLQMYLKGGQGHTRICQDLEFRIASYYLFREESIEKQKKGFNIVKKLAIDGHPDGLCLYGMIWNHGSVAGIEAKPHLAVKYWRQAAEAGHLASLYELGVALYMGDGTVEDPVQAVKYFRQAADLGHSGAAYLLADCFLDGVGVERDRSKAFEWLMTAAEMGHRQAQKRGEALLTCGISVHPLAEPPLANSMSSSSSSTGTTTKWEQEESIRWVGPNAPPPSDWYRKVSLERRFTIGGGSRNPTILIRRKTNVAESRRTEG